jgi:hypothetical protein
MNQTPITTLRSETFEWDKWQQQLHHIDESNIPMRVNFDQNGARVYHGDDLIGTFMDNPHRGVVFGVCISHKGEWLAMVAHNKNWLETTVYLYDMKTMTLSWEECFETHESEWYEWYGGAYDLHFSPDDSKILVMHNEDPLELDSSMFCAIFHTNDGRPFTKPAFRDSTNLSVKAYFGQDILLAPGWDMQPGSIDFCIIDLNKRGEDGELEAGIYMDIESDIVGSVIRLHGWRADSSKFVIVCVKNQEIYMSIYDGGMVDVVSSYQVNEDEKVINSGVSLDGTQLAIMLQSANDGYWMVLLGVEDLKPLEQVQMSTEYNMHLQTMIDQPMIMDTKNNTVTVYCRDVILMLYLEDNHVECRVFQTLCVAFSDGDNIFSEGIKKEKALSLMMAFHERLGTKSMLGCVDADVVRRMIIPETYGLMQ